MPVLSRSFCRNDVPTMRIGENMKNNKKIILGVIALILTASVLAVFNGDAKKEATSKATLHDIKTRENYTYYDTITERYVNSTCVWDSTNQTYEPCYYYVDRIIQLTGIRTIKEYQEVRFNKKAVDVTALNLWCYEDTTNIICKSTSDGDGRLHIKGLKEGTSYTILDKNDYSTASFKGHHKIDIRNSLTREILE